MPPAATDATGLSGPQRHAAVEVRGINCKIANLLWSYGKVFSPHCMSEGAACVEVTGCDLRLLYDVEMTKGGVVLTVLGSEVQVQKLDIKMNKSSSAAWLYNILLSVLNRRLTRIIQQSLTTAIAVQVKKRMTAINSLTLGMFSVALGPDVERIAREKREEEWKSDVALHASPFAMAPAAGNLFTLKNCLDVHMFANSSSAVCKVVMMTELHDARPPPFLREVSAAFGEHILFGFVPGAVAVPPPRRKGLILTGTPPANPSPNAPPPPHPLCLRYGISTLPSILILPPHASLDETIDGKPEPEHVVYPGDPTADALGAYLKAFDSKLGKVTPLSADSIGIFASQVDNASLVIYLAGGDGGPDDKLLRAGIEDLAVKHAKSNPPARFGIVHRRDERVSSFLGLTADGPTPSAVVIPPTEVCDAEYYCHNQGQLSGRTTPPSRVRRDWRAASHIVSRDTPSNFLRSVESALSSYQCDPSSGVVSLSSRNIDLFLSQRAKAKKVIVVHAKAAADDDKHGSLPLSCHIHDAARLARETIDRQRQQSSQVCVGEVLVEDRESSRELLSQRSVLQRLGITDEDLPALIELEPAPGGGSPKAGGGSAKVDAAGGVGSVVRLRVAPIVHGEPVEDRVALAKQLALFHAVPLDVSAAPRGRSWTGRGKGATSRRISASREVSSYAARIVAFVKSTV